MTSLNSKKCVDCNLEYLAKYRFCTECGQELKMMNICKGCSAPLNKASKFCSNCGTSTNPNKAVTVVKHVHVPYSASKNESTEEDPDKAKALLIGLGIVVGLSSLIYIFEYLGGDSQQNPPANPTIADLIEQDYRQRQFRECVNNSAALGLNPGSC